MLCFLFLPSIINNGKSNAITIITSAVHMTTDAAIKNAIFEIVEQTALNRVFFEGFEWKNLTIKHQLDIWQNIRH